MRVITRYSLLRLSAFILVLAGGYAAFHWYISHASSSYNADLCVRRIEQTIDPLALQSWAGDLLRQNVPGDIKFENRAGLLAKLDAVWDKSHPSVYLREGNIGEENYIFVFWGSGVMGHWGLYVGSPTFVPNDMDKCRQWKPGIYFWQDLH
jgi:hypothetical protein